MKQKRYNQEFKETIINLYRSGTPVNQLSSEYGVSEVTIYKWIKMHSPIEGTNELTPADISEIQKENLRLKQEVEIFKKGYDHIREKVTDQEVINHIHVEKAHYSIQMMCRVLKIPKSTYYQAANKKPSVYQLENEQLTTRIRDIHRESNELYGAPKIHFLLCREGWKVSIKRIQRLMRQAGIRSTIIKKYRPTKTQHLIKERENHLNQDFQATSINEKWVADITYIYTLRDGWCYLASVLDLHSKKIVGYKFSRQMTVELVTQALENAILTQEPLEGLIVHTDLGTQYTSEAFQKQLKKHGIIASFSRKGCPYDNACIESFHATLKKEEVYRNRYSNFETAKLALFQYIESWYNRKRIHGAINYLTPDEVERLCRSTL
ncbi:IS3 family transposase [Metabacillus fastidiosus]